MLDNALDRLEAAGIHTVRVDAFQALNEIVSNAAKYGFTNATDQGILTGGTGEGYVFWDSVHPTTAAHELMAAEALVTIIKEYSPRQSQKIPLRSAASLKGLVK